MDGGVDAVDEAREVGRDADDEGGDGAPVDAVGVAVDAIVVGCEFGDYGDVERERGGKWGKIVGQTYRSG